MFAPSRRTFSRPRIAAPARTDALVQEALDGHLWRLDDGRTARQAVSCLVAPQPGDRVLLAESSEGRLYVLHVLEREERGSVMLTVPGAQRLSIRQGSVHVAADRELALCAGEEAQLTAVRGPLMLTGRHLFASAAESMVSTARSYVGQVEQFLLSARQLLRLHGEQAIVTARQDAKIDAERISLG
jgi:hypothetical protein